MEAILLLRRGYLVGLIITWNAILGVSLFAQGSKGFEIAFTLSMLAIGATAAWLSFDRAARARLYVPSNEGAMSRIPSGLRWISLASMVFALAGLWGEALSLLK